MRTVTNYFIVNLSLADILVTITCLPATLVVDITETWFFGQTLCKVIPYLQVLFFCLCTHYPCYENQKWQQHLPGTSNPMKVHTWYWVGISEYMLRPKRLFHLGIWLCRIKVFIPSNCWTSKMHVLEHFSMLFTFCDLFNDSEGM